MEKEKDKKILWRPVYNCNSCDQNNIWIYHQQSNSFFSSHYTRFFLLILLILIEKKKKKKGLT